MDARMMESWLRMTADAVHGADQAQRAIKALGENPMSPAALSNWMSAWMPEAAGAGRRPAEAVGEFKEMLEQWWSTIGAVPLHQYQDLRTRHDELMRRLREAEATIAQLRTTLAARGYEEEAQGLLDTWERVTQQTLEKQAAWTATWLGNPSAQAGAQDDEDGQEQE